MTWHTGPPGAPKLNRNGCAEQVEERAHMPLWAPQWRGRVLHDRHIEPLLNELAQVVLDAEVGGHTGEDHVVDAPLAQLQDQPPARRLFLGRP